MASQVSSCHGQSCLREGKLKADIKCKKGDQGFKTLDLVNKLRYSFSCQSFSNVCKISLITLTWFVHRRSDVIQSSSQGHSSLGIKGCDPRRGIPLHGLEIFRHVQPQMVWSFSRFDYTWEIDFGHFSLK